MSARPPTPLESTPSLTTVPDVAGRLLKAHRGPAHRAQFGQFFTPPGIAAGMAKLSRLDRPNIRLLDPGAGVGALTAAWVAEVCRRVQRPGKIEATAFEIDDRLHEALTTTLVECAALCDKAGIAFSWTIRPDDFIAAGVDALEGGLFSGGPLAFDVAILNPPYKKFRADSSTRSLLRRIGVDTSNLYAAFLSLTVSSLSEGGEMIAITPRSFCNGPYFRQLRRQLLGTTSLDHIHVFKSRSAAFKEDRVLQENIVFRLVRQATQQPFVTLVESEAPGAPDATTRSVSFAEIVRPDDLEQFIHLAPTVSGQKLSAALERLPRSLADLGLTVSTGRVVDFRVRSCLRADPAVDTAPLIYPTHFATGAIVWPKVNTRKPNAIVRCPVTEQLMVPAGFYTLVKRFSSKEERRRITAAVLDPTELSGPVYGFENHLNYFHRDGLPLDEGIARGLAAYLNSTAVDQYFRHFNGHTQVNATDLRSLRYPTKAALVALGETASRKPTDLQSAIDEAVNELLGLTP